MESAVTELGTSRTGAARTPELIDCLAATTELGALTVDLILMLRMTVVMKANTSMTERRGEGCRKDTLAEERKGWSARRVCLGLVLAAAQRAHLSHVQCHTKSAGFADAAKLIRLLCIRAAPMFAAIVLSPTPLLSMPLHVPIRLLRLWLQPFDSSMYPFSLSSLPAHTLLSRAPLHAGHRAQVFRSQLLATLPALATAPCRALRGFSR